MMKRTSNLWTFIYIYTYLHIRIWVNTFELKLYIPVDNYNFIVDSHDGQWPYKISSGFRRYLKSSHRWEPSVTCGDFDLSPLPSLPPPRPQSGEAGHGFPGPVSPLRHCVAGINFKNISNWIKEITNPLGISPGHWSINRQISQTHVVNHTIK